MKKIFLVLAVLFLSGPIHAQESDLLRITQRYDLRKKVDGAYQGLFYGFSTISQQDQATGGALKVLRSEESKRDLVPVEKPLAQEALVTFRRGPDGIMTDFQGDRVSMWRNFPGGLPQNYLQKQVWEAYAEILVDPMNTGKPTGIKVLVEYRLVGPGVYQGQNVAQVQAKYALRYRKGQDPQGDLQMENAQGTHETVISYSLDSGRPLFARTKALEQYQISGKKVTQEGIYLTFYQGFPGFTTTDEGDKTQRLLERDPIPGVVMTPTDQGLKLTLEDLKFQGDQAVLLPGQEDKLDRIAGILKQIKQRQFLVTGHTADLGRPQEQLTLSKDRALAIVKALTQRGVEARNFLYQGKGATQPLAPSDTEENRAKNRRVEILILQN